MLFYDRVIPFRPPIYTMNSPRSSEETVRPELRMGCANGSTLSVSTLSSMKDSGVGLAAATVPEPRIVTRITAGRMRSGSVVSSSEMVNGVESARLENGTAYESDSIAAKDDSSVHQNGNGSLSGMEDSDADKNSSADSNSIGERIRIVSNGKPLMNGKSKHNGLSLPERPSSQPSVSSTIQNHSDIRTPSPTPSSPPSFRSPKTRIKAPQPIRAHLTNTNVPVQLGLLA